MKKLKQILIFFLMTNFLFASEAVIIVVQAPLLKEPKMDSIVLQYKRNEEHVYVPNEIAKKFPLPEFIETFDRTGGIAYLPSKYIKVITNDETEYLTPITYQGNDPTDYRLVEPISKSYPFTDYSFLKVSFSVSIGNNLKDPYAFNKTINSQNYSAETGGRFLVTKKMSFDKYDRFYYGTIIHISSVTNNFKLNNGSMLEVENRSTFKIGPLLVYDSYKNEKYRISIGTGFTYNYHRSILKLAYQQFTTSDYVETETRLFNGFSLSPLVTAYGQVENVIPNIDLVFGSDISLNLNHTLKASGPATHENFWNGDEITGSTKPQASLYIGFQAKY